tara:strand:- start:869 stop:1309 length:441 start_codon:yes stop_codon:yes gene_type:complete
MSEQAEQMQAPRSFWLVASVSLIWNLIGVMNYLFTVTVSPQTLATMSEAQRVQYTDVPVFVTSCFAIAVFSGVLGSVFLLLRKALSVSLFLVSLVAIILQMSLGVLLTPMLAAQGPIALAFPVLLIACAVFFFWYARKVTAQGLLH